MQKNDFDYKIQFWGWTNNNLYQFHQFDETHLTNIRANNPFYPPNLKISQKPKPFPKIPSLHSRSLSIVPPSSFFKSRKYKTHTYNQPHPRLNLQWKNHHKPSRRPKASLSESQLWLAFTFGIFKLFFFYYFKNYFIYYTISFYNIHNISLFINLIYSLIY